MGRRSMSAVAESERGTVTEHADADRLNPSRVTELSGADAVKGNIYFSCTTENLAGLI